jgi:hypothetical protein
MTERCHTCSGTKGIANPVSLGPAVVPCPDCGGTGLSGPLPHECQYDGHTWIADNAYLQVCGISGWLCDRCKLDAAGRLVEMVCKALDRIYVEMK